MLETTIKVSRSLREQLKERLQQGESYNDFIVRLLQSWIVLFVRKQLMITQKMNRWIVLMNYQKRWIFRSWLMSIAWNSLANLTDKIMYNSRIKKRSKTHDFSLVLSRKKTYCVVACTDYPRCQDTITIFVKRFSWCLKCILPFREVKSQRPITNY